MAPFLSVGGFFSLAFSFPKSGLREVTTTLIDQKRASTCEERWEEAKRHTGIHRIPRKQHGTLRSHSTVISPISPLVFSASAGNGGPSPPFREESVANFHTKPADDTSETHDISSSTTYNNLSDLCTLLDVKPLDLLRLETCSDGVRGVYLNRPVRRDDIILRIPLDSCLRDDEPPTWLADSCDDDDEDETATAECDVAAAQQFNPSKWATRLAASLLEVQLSSTRGKGKEMWLSMLPARKFLRASLPVHWSESVLSSAKCTALELAVDAAYFARSEAVADLLVGLGESNVLQGGTHSKEDFERMCHDALDVIQTRSCRVERRDGVQWGPPLRILAPVFDFINHGSNKCSGDGCANAYFELEGGDIMTTDDDPPALVVRAKKDLDVDEEVLLDYGASARPPWRCLASYGFVPDYKSVSVSEDGDSSSGDESDDERSEDENIAEVYMDGVRYEVGPSTVPVEMVEAAAAAIHAEELMGMGIFTAEQLDDDSYDLDYGGDYDYANTETAQDETHASRDEEREVALLTPSVALRIAKRVSDVAFQLLLDSDKGDGSDEEEKAPEEIIAARLAASLRWSQHQVLLACAVGLRDYAARVSLGME